MRSVTYRLEDLNKILLDIGFVGENEHTVINFDSAKLFEEYPDAVVALTVVSPSGEAYPAVTVRDGDIVSWTVKDSDLVTHGNGELQLTFTEGTTVAKSYSARTIVHKSIEPTSDVPTPVENWLIDANTALAAIPQTIDTALEQAKESGEFKGDKGDKGDTGEKGDPGEKGEKGDPGEQGEQGEPGEPGQDGVDGKDGKDGKDGEDGQDGQDGISPTVTVTDITGGHRVVITDATGPHSFDVMDGQGGGTVTVDDELSDTSTNPVQNKVITEEVTSLREAIVPLPTTDDSTATGIDLDVSDEDGNVLLRLQNGHIKTKYFDSETAEAKTTHVTVKTDGTGDYTTLRGAIEYINAQGDCDPVDHPYQIDIYPGTYNVFSAYTQEEIETADVADYHNGFVGPMISDGMSIVGVGDRKSIILYGELSTSTYNLRTRQNISTLNTQGNCRLENLTVIAINIRYCVHDDFYYYGKQYNRIVRNCDFIGKNLAHSPACTWGGGMCGKGENALFENCDFGTDYGHHFDATESTKLIFRNCRGRKMRLAERNRAVNHYVVIEDSDFEMISLMRPNDVSSQHIHVVANGCADAYISDNDGDVVLTAAITKTPLTNLPVGTMVRRVTTIGNGYESTSDPATADGFIVANDDYYSYVQRTGYINTRILEMTGFSLGDYITIDGNNALTTGGTAANAVGVITFISNDYDTIDQGVGFIKMLVGGMK